MSGHIHLNVFVDFRRVDFHMDFLCLGHIGLQVARDAIVKAHAQGDHQVGVLNGVVYPGLTVHPHHPEIQRMGCRKRAEAKQRHRHRNPRPRSAK